MWHVCLAGVANLVFKVKGGGKLLIIGSIYRCKKSAVEIILINPAYLGGGNRRGRKLIILYYVIIFFMYPIYILLLHGDWEACRRQ